MEVDEEPGWKRKWNAQEEPPIIGREHIPLPLWNPKKLKFDIVQATVRLNPDTEKPHDQTPYT